METKVKIALFHDRFRNIGGAEKFSLIVAQQLRCDIITAEANPSAREKLGFSNVTIIPLGKRLHAPLGLSLMLSAIWKKRFSDCDLSSEYDFFIFSGNFSIYAAHKHKPNMWYCHTPPKPLPEQQRRKTPYQRIVEVKNKLVKRQLLPPFVSKGMGYLFDFLPPFIFSTFKKIMSSIKKIVSCIKVDFFYTLRTYATYHKYNSSTKMDAAAVADIDRIIANSQNIQKKVRSTYGRESTVIYPPVTCDNFFYKTNGDFWLSVNRIVPLKRVEMQIDAFKNLPHEKLIIVGDCEEPEREYSEKILERLPSNVTYLGSVSEEKICELYATCKAFITTAKDEDFGMTAVEAMASGKPVIAPNEGGYKESIVNGVTGMCIDEIDAEKLAEAVCEMGKDPQKYKEACMKRAREFDTKVCIANIKKEIGI